MNIIDIIGKKRDGGVLTAEEIAFFVKGYTDGTIADYQASALLMAICLKGMTEGETSDLTLCIRDSGDVVDLSGIEGIKVDKHSTGGVGDKTTLVVAPIVASCGVRVAKMSGRGLGHTGGTLDKLESIKGFSTTMERERFIKTVNTAGLSVIGQSGNLAPADKRLYALRDVTGTIDSIPLIASSIMGKKLASGADKIVLDVKTGNGAFMTTFSDGLALARAMVEIGKTAGKPTTALITDMESPLGRAVGNSLEVAEAIETLKGSGEERFVTLCLSLAAEMLFAAGKGSVEECLSMAKEAVDNGKALTAFRVMVIAQGGDPRCVDDTGLLPWARVIHPFVAEKSGFISQQKALFYGKAACALGAGRMRKEDSIDHSAGVYINKKPGDWVEKGEAIALMHTSDATLFSQAEAYMRDGTSISDVPPDLSPVVIGKINEKGAALWTN